MARRCMSVSVDRIWRLTRQPFILPCTPRVQHRCKWEIFAAGRAGCTVCGAIHVCDQLTCQHQIMTEDSILCSITGCFLNKIYGSETWSDRSICTSLDKKHVSELTYDIETHLHDLLLSNNAKAYTQFEQDNYVSRLSSLIEHCGAQQDGAQQCDCVTDVLGSVLQKIPWRIPLAFCATERDALKKRCMVAINTSASMLFKNKYFKICRGNQKAIVFGLVYLLRTGVTRDAQVVLPRLLELHAVLPLEAHLKAFFGVSPSSITDTENRLKFVIRQNTGA